MPAVLVSHGEAVQCFLKGKGEYVQGKPCVQGLTPAMVSGSHGAWMAPPWRRGYCGS